jgi:cytochrome c oxidase subunit 2
VLLTILAAAAGPRVHGQAAQDDVQVVSVVAERFTFTPSEIRVKADMPLRIELRSDDTGHGFRLLGTDINLEIPKRSRGIATVTLTPTEGRYTFECSRLCGAGHSFMRGVIVASKP